MLHRLCLPAKHCIYIWEYGVWVVYRLSIRHMVSQPISTAYPLYDPTGDMER
jgi:hypothetical protein